MSTTRVPSYRSPVCFSADHIGPPGTVNGGWVAGTVARHLGAGPVEVTLHAPTPPDTRLVLDVGDGEAVLATAGHPLTGTVLVTARVVERPAAPPAPPPVAPADIDPTGFLGWTFHPFPDCIVCGTTRAPGAGLRLFPAPVTTTGPHRTVAALWEPHGGLADDDGTVDPAAVWGALDCPTGWVHATEDPVVAVLGRLTGELLAPVTAGRRYVVVAAAAGADGRKLHSCAGIYDDRAELVAWSEATWITLR
jgi:hypothetical protein